MSVVYPGGENRLGRGGYLRADPLTGGEAREGIVTYFSVLLGRLLPWLPRAAGALYAGMILMTYRTNGPRCRPAFQHQDLEGPWSVLWSGWA